MIISAIMNGGLSLTEIIAYVLSAIAVIFLTLPIHEWAHAYTATRLGDPTPRYDGRLTLNPFAHIDYVGALGVLLCGIGWAKPVSINTRYFRNPKWDMALTALAGPVCNLVVAFIILFIMNTVLFFTEIMGSFVFFVCSFLFYIAQINVGLAVFNLIPIPPLDGSRLLSAFLPNRLYYKLMRYERVLFYVILALVITGVLGGPIDTATNAILGVFTNLIELFFSIF